MNFDRVVRYLCFGRYLRCTVTDRSFLWLKIEIESLYILPIINNLNVKQKLMKDE